MYPSSQNFRVILHHLLVVLCPRTHKSRQASWFPARTLPTIPITLLSKAYWTYPIVAFLCLNWSELSRCAFWALGSRCSSQGDLPCTIHLFLVFLPVSSTLDLPGRRQRQPTPVLLPGKSHGRRSLVGYSPWGREELDTTEWLNFHFSLSCTGGGNSNPLQYFCLENPRDGSLVGCCLWGRTESDTTDMF